MRSGDVPLVFIHGLLGSVLVEPGGQVRWLTAASALRLSTPQLDLPLVWRDGVQRKDGLRPAGLLEAVEVLPGVGREIYRPWLRAASQIPGRPLHVFTYDWRRDNGESCGLFAGFLEGLSRRYSGRKVQVVAHSMGGLVTLCAWNRRPDLIGRVVFAGVPFRGGIGYLDNMFLGTPAGLNKRILSARVLFSLPSVYSFYPAGGSFESKDLLEDEHGRLVQLDFYDPSVWKSNGFGPYAPENRAWANEQTAPPEFLAAVLRQGRAFRRTMQPSGTLKVPPVLVIMSKDHQTLARARRMPKKRGEAVPRWDFEAAALEPGDDSVLYKHALPPPPIPYRVFLTHRKHTDLLSDQAVQREIARFLRE